MIASRKENSSDPRRLHGAEFRREEIPMNRDRSPLGGWSTVPYAREAALQGGQMAFICFGIILLSIFLGYGVHRFLKRSRNYDPRSSILIPTMVASLLGALLLGSVAYNVSSGSRVDGEANNGNIIRTLEKRYPMNLGHGADNVEKITKGEDFKATVKGKNVTCNIESTRQMSPVTPPGNRTPSPSAPSVSNPLKGKLHRHLAHSPIRCRAREREISPRNSISGLSHAF